MKKNNPKPGTLYMHDSRLCEADGTQPLPEGARELKVLHLTLKRKWFDMIASGEKREEYREIKDYWRVRFTEPPTPAEGYRCWDVFDVIRFRNGYGRNAPDVIVNFKEFDMGKPIPGWAPDESLEEVHYIVRFGEILEIGKRYYETLIVGKKKCIDE